MKATDLLQQAAHLVGGERDRQHGEKHDNFRRIAILWNAWLEARWGVNLVTGLDATDVAQMMSLLKKARTLSGSHNPDDYVDDAGYTACAGEINERYKVSPGEAPICIDLAELK